MLGDLEGSGSVEEVWPHVKVGSELRLGDVEPEMEDMVVGFNFSVGLRLLRSLPLLH